MTLPPDEDALDQFAAQIAHDFNNLLTGVLGNLELLEYRAARYGVEGLTDYIKSARSAGGRAADFAQRLMLFSGCGAQPPCRVPVADLLASLEEAYRSRATKLTLGPVPPGAMLFCDPARAALALAELLDNAADAVAAAGGEVRLETQLAPEQILLCVRDTGPGMAAEILARAAEPFFTTHSSSAGKGLGLTMAARFATQAGGQLLLQSEAGCGCAVTLALPRG